MREKPTEHTNIWRSAALPGVEMMRARYTRHSFSKHFHEGYCLGVIEQGSLAFRYRGENLVAPAGSVNLAVPGEVHDGHGADEAGWAYRMFYLNPDALACAVAQFSPRPAALPHFRPGVIHDPQLAALLYHFHQDLELGRCSAMEVQARFLSLLARWVRVHADEPPAPAALGSEHRAVARAREIMESRYAEDLSLDELAREAGLSPYHLARTFSRQVGMPPHGYLTQVRVNRAAGLVAGPDGDRPDDDGTGEALPLAQVAASVGFADQAHLTRQFKRLRGVTPGAYRRAFRPANWPANRKIVQYC